MTRLWNILDACSQLGNAVFLPRPDQTSANESISGRAHRMGWRWLARAIDTALWFDRDGARGHCELADERDYIRARQKVNEYEGRQHGI